MEERMAKEMYWAHCCWCGQKICKSAPGPQSETVCPRCGAELEVQVAGKAVRVTVLKMKEPRAAVAAR